MATIELLEAKSWLNKEKQEALVVRDTTKLLTGLKKEVQLAQDPELPEQEQRDILDNNVGTDEGRDIIIEKIKNWDIGQIVFAKWYADNIPSENEKDKTIPGLTMMFNNIKGINWEKKMKEDAKRMKKILEKMTEAG